MQATLGPTRYFIQLLETHTLTVIFVTSLVDRDILDILHFITKGLCGTEYHAELPMSLAQSLAIFSSLFEKVKVKHFSSSFFQY